VKGRISLLMPIGLLIFSCCVGSTVLDPFGMPLKPGVPNCGPEMRHKFPSTTIRSEGEFVQFLQTHESDLADVFGYWVRLDNFREVEPGAQFPEIQQSPVAWDQVLEAVTIRRAWGRAIYSLDYQPVQCPGQSFRLKMTRHGHVSVYGCCGV
jgi:hypothetical protein